jgi:hypothetical protein
MQLSNIELHYGGQQPLSLPFDADRFRSFHPGPAALADFRGSVRAALVEPRDFPPLSATCIPDDRIVIVLDQSLPQAAVILSEVVKAFSVAGVPAEQLTVLEPALSSGRSPADPRSELPEAQREAVTWTVHQPDEADQSGYLASSVAGERIYLARELLDADVVLPIYTAGFDSVLGYRNTGNLMYPRLSNTATREKFRGEGHRELLPDDDRPLRQLGEEICWLLGIQFAVAVVPGRTSGSAAAIYGGQWEAVQRESRQFVNHAWTVSLPQRAETVVVSVPATSHTVGWDDIGNALSVARELVVREGRIILLSSINAALQPIGENGVAAIAKGLSRRSGGRHANRISGGMGERLTLKRVRGIGGGRIVDVALERADRSRAIDRPDGRRRADQCRRAGPRGNSSRVMLRQHQPRKFSTSATYSSDASNGTMCPQLSKTRSDALGIIRANSSP